MGTFHRCRRLSSRSHGGGEPPLVAQTDALWSVIANAGAGLRYFFDQTVSAGLDVSAIALFPRAVIAIDDQHSAPAAVQGLASLSLGLAF